MNTTKCIYYFGPFVRGWQRSEVGRGRQRQVAAEVGRGRQRQAEAGRGRQRQAVTYK